MTELKVLVVSDSHHWMNAMYRIVERESPDQIIHLGDHAADANRLREKFPLIPVVSVRGNCDYASDEKEQIVTEWDGIRFLICHGHRYHVKTQMLAILLAAKEKQADVALFGHTHCPVYRKADNIILFNPGSCGRSDAYYGVILLANGEAHCHLKKLNEVEA